MRKRLGELASCGETEKGGHGLWRLKGDVADPYGGVAELKTAAASAPSRNLVRSVSWMISCPFARASARLYSFEQVSARRPRE
jgi:hypothetical protein